MTRYHTYRSEANPETFRAASGTSRSTNPSTQYTSGHHHSIHAPSPYGKSEVASGGAMEIDGDQYYTPPSTPPALAVPMTRESLSLHNTIQDLEFSLRSRRLELSRVEHRHRRAQLSVKELTDQIAQHRALMAYIRNRTEPAIAKLPVELLIRIFAYIQNSVVVSHVCSLWREVAFSSPRLWSSLHVHPSKGPSHLQNLLTHSMGQTIEVCFCPTPSPPPPLSNAQQLSLPPLQHQEDSILSSKVVSVLAPHTNRFRSFEMNATVPGTWFTLLPVLKEAAPHLRTFQVSTTLADDFSKLTFFNGETPELSAVNITGAFPSNHLELLSNLTKLRLEAIPPQFQPTTRQFATVLRACPNLVSLSMLDAGPKYGVSPWEQAELSENPIVLSKLQGLAFRESYDGSPFEGSGWLLANVHMPSLLSLHLMQLPGTGIAHKVPCLPSLQEFYLWAPGAQPKDVVSLLWKLPNLVSLELPSIRTPLEVVAALCAPQAVPLQQPIVDHARFETHFGGPNPSAHLVSSLSMMAPVSTPQPKREWICPRLERFGMPNVRLDDGRTLEVAFQEIWCRRGLAHSRGELASPVESIIAPAGRPESISAPFWDWLKGRFTIRSFKDGNMDMLFDRLPVQI